MDELKQTYQCEEEFEQICAREQRLIASRGELFTRVFGLKISLPITHLFLRLGVSANLAMFFMWLVGLFGAVCVAIGGKLLVLGFALLLLHYVLDYCDGQIARQHQESSLVGGVRDRWIHFTVQASAFFGLGVYLWGEFQSPVHLLPAALIYTWFQFRIMISNLPQAMFCSEFTGYHSLETDIIQRNHRKVLAEEHIQEPESEPKAQAAASEAKKVYKPKMRHEIRNVMINFDGFNLIMIAVSLLSLLAPQFTNFASADVVLGALWALVVFYALNAIDYSLTYLFSFRINRDMVAIGKRLKRR